MPFSPILADRLNTQPTSIFFENGWGWKQHLPDGSWVDLSAPEGSLSVIAEAMINSGGKPVGFKAKLNFSLFSSSLTEFICLLHTCEEVDQFNPRIPVSLHFSNMPLTVVEAELYPCGVKVDWTYPSGIIGFGSFALNHSGSVE